MGRRPKRGADGVVRDVVYDCYHKTYEGFDKERLNQLVKEMHNPIILTSESFPLVKEITKTGEAVLSQDFVQQYKELVQAMEKRESDITKLPQRKPKYARENIIALSNVPRKAFWAVVESGSSDVYV